MNPAFSVIFLTTLLGVGQGLFLALYTAQLYSLFGLLAAHQGGGFHAIGAAVALTFLAAGLAASFFHLGHPERAWRAASQWRTSWLSREVIVLPMFMAAVALYGLAHGFGWTGTLFVLPGGYAVDATLILGGIGTLLAFGLFVATAMIYACLRFLQEWHTPLTVINYVLLGAASGFTLATALAGLLAPGLASFFAGWAALITGLAFVFRVASLLRNARIRRKSALQTAIGVKHPRIVQKSQGFTGGSFNTREFSHRRSSGWLRSVKWVFLLLVFVLPPFLMGGGLASLSAVLSFAAFLTQYAGLLAERWFFFAQANHPQNLYYQAVS